MKNKILLPLSLKWHAISFFSWHGAEKYFLDALEKIQAVSSEVIAEKWEPLLNNMGHTCRKLK